MLTNFVFNKLNYIVADDVQEHNLFSQYKKKVNNELDNNYTSHTSHSYLHTLFKLKLICENLDDF